MASARMGGARLLVTLVVHFSLVVLAVARQNSSSAWDISIQFNYTTQPQTPGPSSSPSWSLGLRINDTNKLAPSPSPSPSPSPLPLPESNSTRQSRPKRGGLKGIVNNVLRKIRAVNMREFLYEHNKVRQEFNEPALVWDKKLARFAERFANQRKQNCDMIHSGNEDYGESIYWGQHYDRHSAAQAVRAWASEGKYYNLQNHTCNEPHNMCGHYTQIIWKTSKRIGCARVKCDNGGVYIICVYDPPGNWRNEDPLTSPE